MQIIPFAGDPATIVWPTEYVDELGELPPAEQLRYFYNTADYARWTKRVVDEGGFEWQSPMCYYTLPVSAVELLDGKVAAVHFAGSRIELGQSVCTYSASDNNGAGYKEREDRAALICGEPINFPRDFWHIEGDTVTFGTNMPAYRYAFQLVQVKPWEREAEEPIRHVIVADDATFMPKDILTHMNSLETVRVPAAIRTIDSGLPDGCQVFVGGIRIPNSFISWDGNLVRVREDVEEIRIMGDIRAILQWAFEDCPSLKRVIIPASVREIAAETFARFGSELTICCEPTERPEGWSCKEFDAANAENANTPKVIWGYTE